MDTAAAAANGNSGNGSSSGSGAPSGGNGSGNSGKAAFLISEAAERLAIPERTIREWVKRGKIPVLPPLYGERGVRIAAAVLEEMSAGRLPVDLGREADPGPSAAPHGNSGNSGGESSGSSSGGSSGGSGNSSSSGGFAPEVELLQARLDGAQVAVQLHAQARREEAKRHQSDLDRAQALVDREREERTKADAQLTFLQERLVQAEQEAHEMRILMAQSVQAQQQTARELQALREERQALMAPKPGKVRWWQKVWGTTPAGRR